jgi:soluble lytic murein transglycosylase-like protein
MRATWWILSGGILAGLGLVLYSRRASASLGDASSGSSFTDLFALPDISMPDVVAVIQGDLYALVPSAQANEKKYLTAITAAEQREGLPDGLLHRQLYQESHFRTDIIDGSTVSVAGAVGIAQIIPRWHPGVNPLDPIASINYAAKYMRQLYNQFGSWSLALAAYNWGPGNVAANGLNNAPPETQQYVAQITADVGVA